MELYREKLFLLIIGAFILTLGVVFIIRADLGVGSWDSVNVGLSRTLGISVGSAAFIVAIIMTILACILRKGLYNIKTLITAFILSFFTDFWLLIFSYFPLKIGLVVRIILFIMGVIILSLGLALYLMSELSPNPLDDFMVAFRERFNLSLGKAKVIIDVIGVFIAFLLSGPIGIGTIGITIFVGPLIDYFNNRLSNYSESYKL